MRKLRPTKPPEAKAHLSAGGAPGRPLPSQPASSPRRAHRPGRCLHQPSCWRAYPQHGSQETQTTEETRRSQEEHTSHAGTRQKRGPKPLRPAGHPLGRHRAAAAASSRALPALGSPPRNPPLQVGNRAAGIQTRSRSRDEAEDEDEPRPRQGERRRAATQRSAAAPTAKAERSGRDRTVRRRPTALRRVFPHGSLPAEARNASRRSPNAREGSRPRRERRQPARSGHCRISARRGSGPTAAPRRSDPPAPPRPHSLPQPPAARPGPPAEPSQRDPRGAEDGNEGEPRGPHSPPAFIAADRAHAATAAPGPAPRGAARTPSARLREGARGRGRGRPSRAQAATPPHAHILSATPSGRAHSFLNTAGRVIGREDDGRWGRPRPAGRDWATRMPIPIGAVGG